MAPLKNRKHENFAHLVVHGAAQGLSQAQMYKLVGYKADGHAAEVAASRLLSNVEIQRRVAEIGAPAVKKTVITAESLIADFDNVIAGASRKDQWGAVNRAIELRGKLKGFLIDRVEIGAPGAFDGVTSAEEVADRLIADARDPHDLLDAMRRLVALVEERVAAMARPVGMPCAESGAGIWPSSDTPGSAPRTSTSPGSLRPSRRPWPR